MDEKEKRAVHEVNHEWTVASIQQIRFHSNWEDQAIADAHNAELAAERLRANQKEGVFMVASEANQQLREQLAAHEQSSWDEIAKLENKLADVTSAAQMSVSALNQRLAAAQAAMKEAQSYHASIAIQEALEGGTAALDAAIVEAHQPLVDALEKYMQAMDAIYNHDVVTRSVVARYFGTRHPPEVIRLLAKAKEEKA